MSEETTHNLSHQGSFEDRVFARFDLIDARLQSLDERLLSVENQAERRAFDTKPIWERALAEIVEVKERLSRVDDRLGAVETGLGEVEQHLVAVDGRLVNLEDLSKQVLRKLNILNNDLLTFRADQEGLETRLEKLEPASPV